MINQWLSDSLQKKYFNHQHCYIKNSIRLLMLLLSLSPFAVQAFSNDAQVKSWLSPGNSVAVHEQVTLNIEIITDTWFTKGTRIHHFEVANAIVLPQSGFAINSTQKIKGKTYTKQLWEIIIYPLQSGNFPIPTITIETEIKNNKKQAVSNKKAIRLTTKSIAFTARNPVLEMTTENSWLVGNNIELKQQWQITRTNSDITELDAPLQIGDAIKRIVTLDVGNSSAMLLPHLLPNNISNNSLLSYPAEPQLKDSQVRGEYQAQKIETITYIAAKSGDIYIPSHNLYFWNTETQQLETLNVSGKTLTVKHTLGSWTWFHRFWIVAIGLFLLVISISSYLSYRYYNILKNTNRLPLTWQYVRAIYNNQYIECENILYQEQLKNNQSARLSQPFIIKETITTNNQQQQNWQQEIEKLQDNRYKHIDDSYFLQVNFSRLWQLRPKLSKLKK